MWDAMREFFTDRDNTDALFNLWVILWGYGIVLVALTWLIVMTVFGLIHIWRFV